jgi:hypothetical protein
MEKQRLLIAELELDGRQGLAVAALDLLKTMEEFHETAVADLQHQRERPDSPPAAGPQN